MNADFGHHQGNSMEVEEMKRRWEKLFLYDVESGVAKGNPQINVIRRVYNDMFMVSISYSSAMVYMAVIP